jgi:hypothetical protein
VQGAKTGLRGSRFQAEEVFVREAYASNCEQMHMPTEVGTHESAHARKTSKCKIFQKLKLFYIRAREKNVSGEGGLTMTSLSVVNILHLRQRD